MSQPFWQTPRGSVPARPDSPHVCPPPAPALGMRIWGIATRCGFWGSGVGDAGHRVPSLGDVQPLGTVMLAKGPWSSVPGWGCQRAPGSRGGPAGCHYSIWSNPDLLTKAELFLKSNHSAKFASAARPAAAARCRGEIRPGKRGSRMPETGGGRRVVPALRPPGPPPWAPLAFWAAESSLE